MTTSSRIVTPVIRFILSMICRIDAVDMKRIPDAGPLIVVLNHVNFLEVPLIYAFLYPRYAVGLVKRETWDNPVLGALADSWEAIAIDRDGVDISAMRKALDVLDRGGILMVAPEGTRSGHGRLQRGHGGVVQLALRSGAPIMPVAHSGGERFWKNFKSCRRTRFTVRVGPVFRLVPPEGGGRSVPRSVRTEMTDAVMNRLALLLPDRQRGAYPEPEAASMRYIELGDRPGAASPSTSSE
ncbi:MAG: 1-acyl-sn-glycerol-3-phosphate acyltransferase [Spirochaetae bacterium HGW-Spirochaetae-3]|jgi:1-acyl-sn-glycerol-3-phosphate acyltransferase|nr:MAG: 1-acyl-sn-glycerol-3-phosphate acyltransferase [Spirochaetae bacterium HGW-Spirochaetae-3]